ncbi:hypothetical protein G6553_01590 [Nocardioides sp. IC4_145]|uniref:hypothetical protein n=1 Tax=Nocardioides sp. IC4_145 TaxID=2714037 RepID=UPI00140D5FF4|nr:hypothetical protein [Nocardioides sp. IC4_145]NHC21867.1 hypothetical protein [Nocardioides sp. IC4_145]
MEEIKWDCAACGFEIADRDGWVHVRMSEVMVQEGAVRAWHEKYPGPSHSLSEISEFPDPVPWNALHEVCDPTGGEPYAIGVEDLRTAWDLIEWTVQLLEKTWLDATNWREVLRRKHHEAQSSSE